MGKSTPWNGKQKKAGVAILIPEKTDFRVKTTKRDEKDTTKWSRD